MSVITTGPRASAPTQHTRALIGSLNREWDELCDLAAPRDDAGVLAAFASIGQVVAHLAARPSPSEADAILIALLRAGHDGSQLAHRAVLQAMLGAVTRLAHCRTGRRRSRIEDSESEAVSAMWQRITTYPLDARPERVAANLKLDALKTLDVMRIEQFRHDHYTIGLGTKDDDPAVTDPDAEDPSDSPALAVIDLLQWAQRTAVLKPAEVRVIALRHLGERELSFAQIADELAEPYDTVNRRYTRAIKKLTQHATAYLG